MAELFSRLSEPACSSTLWPPCRPGAANEHVVAPYNRREARRCIEDYDSTRGSESIQGRNAPLATSASASLRRFTKSSGFDGPSTTACWVRRSHFGMPSILASHPSSYGQRRSPSATPARRNSAPFAIAARASTPPRIAERQGPLPPPTAHRRARGPRPRQS